MPSIITRIEEAALALDWAVLLTAGIVMVVVGMVLWLGGLRYSGLIFGLFGAIVGAGLGQLTSQIIGAPALACVGIGAVVVALAAIFLKEAMIFFMAVLIFALACGLVYLSYSVNTESWRQHLEQVGRDVQNDPEAMAESSVSEEIEWFRSWSDLPEQAPPPSDKPAVREYVLGRLKAVLAEVRLYVSAHRGSLILWIVGGGLVGLLIALLLKKVIMAVCCSIVGSTAVFFGVLAIMVAKQVHALTALRLRPALTPVLLGTMILVGFVTQLALARPSKKPAEEAEEK